MDHAQVGVLREAMLQLSRSVGALTEQMSIVERLAVGMEAVAEATNRQTEMLAKELAFDKPESESEEEGDEPEPDDWI